MKKPYFSMLGAIICAAVIGSFVWDFFQPLDTGTKFAGIIQVWMVVYAMPFVFGFLWFVWRILQYKTWLERSHNEKERADS